MMDVSLSATGRTTTCTGKVDTHGQMEGPTREITSTTKRMALASMSTLTDDVTRASGKKVNSMDKELSSHLKAKRNEVNGIMANV